MWIQKNTEERREKKKTMFEQVRGVDGPGRVVGSGRGVIGSSQGRRRGRVRGVRMYGGVQRSGCH